MNTFGIVLTNGATSVRTTSTAEVFLPSDTKGCN